MKKIVLIVIAGLLSIGVFAQTPTNFTANDCASNSHTLFTELDAGKIIVISFVMPCGTCIAPTLAADAAVQSYQSGNPGQVLFYMSDDVGTTSCSTLNGWAGTNSITPDATFANTAFKMNQYGTGTMNRVVVMGGTSHTVYYNAGSGVSQTNIQNAINTALAAVAAGMEDNQNNINILNVYPNPANEAAYITYSLKEVTDVKINLYNVLGEKVQSVVSAKQNAGDHKVELNTSNLNNGIYFINVNGSTFKFEVSN